MVPLAQAGLTVPAVASRGLNEGLGITAPQLCLNKVGLANPKAAPPRAARTTPAGEGPNQTAAAVAQIVPTATRIQRPEAGSSSSMVSLAVARGIAIASTRATKSDNLSSVGDSKRKNFTATKMAKNAVTATNLSREKRSLPDARSIKKRGARNRCDGVSDGGCGTACTVMPNVRANPASGGRTCKPGLRR